MKKVILLAVIAFMVHSFMYGCEPFNSKEDLLLALDRVNQNAQEILVKDINGENGLLESVKNLVATVEKFGKTVDSFNHTVGQLNQEVNRYK